MPPNQGYVPSPGASATPAQTPKPPRDTAKLTFVLALAFGFTALVLLALFIWALIGKNTAEGEVEQRIAQVVAEAREDQRAADAAAERARLESETRTYTAPAVFGSLNITFPKPWNVFVEENESSNTQLDGYIHPGLVRQTVAGNEQYAFRFALERELYTQALSDFKSSNNSNFTATPITVSGIRGTKISGEIDRRGKTGILVLLPVRDKTLRLWTEGSNFTGQYNTIIGSIKITP